MSDLIFKADSIRSLRLRLGWSLADMARHLQCDPEAIAAWECGKSQPSSDLMQNYELLLHRADAAADELAQAPRLEAFLEERDLNQCSVSELIDSPEKPNDTP